MKTKKTFLEVQPEHIPEELKCLTQWVLWRSEIRNGKPTKVPYQPHHPSRCASVSNPNTWGSFVAALQCYEATRRWDGIGLVLTPNDPYVGVDLDHCLDPATGNLSPEAETIVRQLASYTEISPSGTGLRIFVRGTLPPTGRKKKWIELYERSHYLTVTGHIFHLN
jgi:primase-polymerase (primpol)-like protein